MSAVVQRRVEARTVRQPSTVVARVIGIGSMPYVAPLARALKNTRELRGLSQLELAQKAGVSRATVVMLERGFDEDDMRLSTLRAVAKALDVQLEVIVGNG